MMAMVPGGTGKWEKTDAALGSSCGGALMQGHPSSSLGQSHAFFLAWSCWPQRLINTMNVTVLHISAGYLLFNYVPREDQVSDHDRQPSAVILAVALLLCTMSGSFLLFWATDDILPFLPSLSLSRPSVYFALASPYTHRNG